LRAGVSVAGTASITASVAHAGGGKVVSGTARKALASGAAVDTTDRALVAELGIGREDVSAVARLTSGSTVLSVGSVGLATCDACSESLCQCRTAQDDDGNKAGNGSCSHFR